MQLWEPAILQMQTNWKIYLAKDQIVNILGFVGHLISATTTQLTITVQKHS